MIRLPIHVTVTRLRDKWRRMLRNRRSMMELASCLPSERHRIAQDLGLSEGELLALHCNHRGPSELMPERLRQLGVDPGYVEHAQTAIYRDLERVCASCTSWRRCSRDLANGNVHAGMEDYCLNAPTIDALAVDPLRL